MAVNRLRMAHERRKVQLRGAILQQRVRQEEGRLKLKRLREELKSLKPSSAQRSE